MNDAAVNTLGVLRGLAMATPPGGLAVGLQERAAQGITLRRNVLTWANSIGNTAGAPSIFKDLMVVIDIEPTST